MFEQQKGTLTVPEAAEILGVTDRTVRGYIYDGLLPADEFYGCHPKWRIKEEDARALKELLSPSNNGLLTAEDVAQIAHISVSCVLKDIRNGRLKATKIRSKTNRNAYGITREDAQLYSKKRMYNVWNDPDTNDSITRGHEPVKDIPTTVSDHTEYDQPEYDETIIDFDNENSNPFDDIPKQEPEKEMEEAITLMKVLKQSPDRLMAIGKKYMELAEHIQAVNRIFEEIGELTDEDAF